MPARIEQIVGVFDGVSARLASRYRFDWLHIGGYNLSASVLGSPDVGLLTMTEMVGRVRDIAPHCRQPVLVDGDDGYGNHLTVIRLAKALEAAGASGVHLEDQQFPKRCGHMAGKRLVDPERFVDKIKAFVDTRTRPEFLLFARTDALAVTGFEDAVDRANRYLQAGADVIFVEAPTTIDEIRALPKQIPGPLLYNWVYGGKSPLLPPAELAEIGYRYVLQADVLYAVTGALERYFGQLEATGTYGSAVDLMVDFDAFNDLIGLADVEAADARYDRGRATE